MERKIKKLLVVTGVVVSAAIAILPLTSYAYNIDPTTYSTPTSGPSHGYGCNDELVDSEGNQTNPCAKSGGNSMAVNVNVDPSLEIDVVANDTTIELEPNTMRTGTFTTNVSSAKSYTISLSGNPTLTNAADESFGIPAKDVLEIGKSGWGIKKPGADGYTALSQVPAVFFEGSPSGDGVDTDFEIGVSASAILPEGVYSTEVTVTAAFKQ